MIVSLANCTYLVRAGFLIVFALPAFSQEVDVCQALKDKYPSVEAASQAQAEFRNKYPAVMSGVGPDTKGWFDAIEAQECWNETERKDPVVEAARRGQGEIVVYRTPILFATNRKVM